MLRIVAVGSGKPNSPSRNMYAPKVWWATRVKYPRHREEGWNAQPCPAGIPASSLGERWCHGAIWLGFLLWVSGLAGVGAWIRKCCLPLLWVCLWPCVSPAWEPVVSSRLEYLTWAAFQLCVYSTDPFVEINSHPNGSWLIPLQYGVFGSIQLDPCLWWRKAVS